MNGQTMDDRVNVNELVRNSVESISHLLCQTTDDRPLNSSHISVSPPRMFQSRKKSNMPKEGQIDLTLEEENMIPQQLITT